MSTVRDCSILDLQTSTLNIHVIFISNMCIFLDPNISLYAVNVDHWSKLPIKFMIHFVELSPELGHPQDPQWSLSIYNPRSRYDQPRHIHLGANFIHLMNNRCVIFPKFLLYNKSHIFLSSTLIFTKKVTLQFFLVLTIGILCHYSNGIQKIVLGRV